MDAAESSSAIVFDRLEKWICRMNSDSLIGLMFSTWAQGRIELQCILAASAFSQEREQELQYRSHVIADCLLWKSQRRWLLARVIHAWSWESSLGRLQSQVDAALEQQSSSREKLLTQALPSVGASGTPRHDKEDHAGQLHQLDARICEALAYVDEVESFLCRRTSCHADAEKAVSRACALSATRASRQKMLVCFKLWSRVSWRARLMLSCTGFSHLLRRRGGFRKTFCQWRLWSRRGRLISRWSSFYDLLHAKYNLLKQFDEWRCVVLKNSRAEWQESTEELRSSRGHVASRHGSEAASYLQHGENRVSQIRWSSLVAKILEAWRTKVMSTCLQRIAERHRGSA